jgi:hypothetical protein
MLLVIMGLPFMYLLARYMLQTLCSHIVPHISGQNSITEEYTHASQGQKAAEIVLRDEHRSDGGKREIFLLLLRGQGGEHDGKRSF